MSRVPAPLPVFNVAVQRSMRSNRPRDTHAELRIRSRLHETGMRFRKNYRPLPRRRLEVDIAFTKRRLAVLIDGCFWHSCPEHGSIPRHNGDWWAAKLKATQQRDLLYQELLEEAGWTVLRFWEHDPVGDVVHAVRAAVLGGIE